MNPSPEPLLARPTTPIVKIHYALRHRPDITEEQARRHWQVQHAPLVRQGAPATGLLRYLQVQRYDTPLESALREPRGTDVDPYFGHTEAWLDRSVRRDSPEARAAGRRFVADAATFIEVTRSSMWIGKELVFVDSWW